MATITATANLYQAFRALAVDENATANLTMSATISATLTRRVGGVINAKTNASISAAGSFAIYGGVAKGATGWSSTSTLRLKHPTYIRIDWDALDMPEGTNVQLVMEEGFVIEDRNKHPLQLGKPLPKLNLMTFRTPIRGKGFFNSQFSFPIGNFRARLFDTDVFSLFSPSVTAKITREGVTDLQTAFQQSAIIGYKRFFAAQLQSIFEGDEPGGTPYLIGNGYEYPPDSEFAFLNPPLPWTFPGILRIREDTANIVYDNAASLSVEAFNLPFIWTLENFTSTFAVSSDVDAFKGVGTPALTSQSTLTAGFRVDYDSFVSAIQSTATIVARPNIDGKANLTAQSSLTCNAISSDSVILKIVVPSGTTLERTFAVEFNGNVLVDIDWGDGSPVFQTDRDIVHSHVYNAGTYFVSIDRVSETGIPLEEWKVVNNGYSAQMVRECLSFGKLNTIRLIDTFNGCVNLTKVPTYLPPTVTDLWNTFRGCSQFNDSAVTLWDTQNVTRMLGTFFGCLVFNQNISGWNTSNVTDMGVMFYSAGQFNQNIGSWNVSKVTNYSSMFGQAVSFNGNIGSWQIRADGTRINMYNMFAQAFAFNQNISSWDVEFVYPISTGATSGMTNMFSQATSFNQDLSGWCVPNIPTQPSNFATGATAWTLPKPVWGTCP